MSEIYKVIGFLLLTIGDIAFTFWHSIIPFFITFGIFVPLSYISQILADEELEDASISRDISTSDHEA